MTPFPDKQYKTIYTDPPWPEKGGGKIKRGADRHYPLMKVKDIIAMPVGDLADDEGCHIYCWVTNNFLPDGLTALREWGFKYISCITWMKDRAGLGQYYRGLTEHCLFGRKGMVPYKLSGEGKRMQGKTGFYAPKSPIHSEKPEEMRRMIEVVSYAPRIELFTRHDKPGWDTWGNEVGKLDGGQTTLFEMGASL